MVLRATAFRVADRRGAGRSAARFRPLFRVAYSAVSQSRKLRKSPHFLREIGIVEEATRFGRLLILAGVSTMGSRVVGR